jgi:hypothetical protein
MDCREWDNHGLSLPIGSFAPISLACGIIRVNCGEILKESQIETKFSKNGEGARGFVVSRVFDDEEWMVKDVE